MAELVEHLSPAIGRLGDSDFTGSNHGQVKTNDFKIDTGRFLARCSTLLEYGKDWLAQCQDNVTDWDIRSWCW